MQPQQDETGKVNVIVGGYAEKLMGNRVEILMIAFDKSEPDKVEVEKMDDQENKY
jgi:hypothetical protein